jgi:phosphate transport system protein
MTGNRREFDRDLEAIQLTVAEIFAMVADDIPAATRALLGGDQQAAGVVAERDQVIDVRCGQLEQIAARTVMLQAPVGPDLRFLLSVLRVVPELERSHDLVTHIAARARRELHQELLPRSRGLVEQLGGLAEDMWRWAALAWEHRDGNAVVMLRGRNQEVAQLHASLLTELGSGQLSVPVTMEMTLVARFYQRLGDHAVTVTGRVSYLAGSRLQEQ